jgi:hypothetical protein
MYGTVCDEMLESKHFEDIFSLIESKKSGTRIMMPKSICALLLDESLFFLSEAEYEKLASKQSFFINITEGISNFENFTICLFPKGKADMNEISALSDKAIFRAKTILPESIIKELFARNRESGEKYVFGGMTRTLKKLISGESEKAKKIRPVFCDGKGIVWFPPFRIRDDIYNKNETNFYELHYFEY